MIYGKRALSHIRGALVAIALLSTMMLTACDTQVAPSEPDPVSVQLKWTHQIQFAGMYVAQEEGYYTEENLDVTLAPFDFENPMIIDQVVSGERDFGITSPEDLVMARSQGKPVQAVAVIFQVTAEIFLVDPSSGIRTPQDFAGHRVGLTEGGLPIIYAAMMNQLGLDRSEIEEVTITTWDLWECWEITPVCPNYATNGPVVLELMGEPYNVIWPQDYGIAWYGDVLFTTEQMVEERPEVVQRFVQATLRGWQTAIEHPDQAVAATLSFNDQLDPEFQEAAMMATIPLVDTGQDPIGWMAGETWQSIVSTLETQGLISTPVETNALFDNSFVEEAQ